MKAKNLNVQPMALLAELVGTFILATVVITVANPIIVGFSLIVLVLAIGAISGSHLNPAITIGLWSVKKFEGAKVPFYIAMQFAGSLLALLVSQMYQGNGFGISFASFNSFDTKIVVAELLGTAVFAFAFVAAVHRELIESAKALCIGLALLTGLAVGGGLLGQAAQSSASATGETQPRVTKIDGAVLNSAIALSATEKVAQQNALQSLSGQTEATPSPQRPSSRLTWETIVGTVVGGAIGANLFMLTAGVNPHKRNKSVTAKVTSVMKKGKNQAKKTTKGKK